ncbi:DUF4148 domain-containing protein [Trinickia fusca]|uniref:DUF4148 domain-containing protein n=1 Tax=Trinickia fusca TaxID=2419777 RepID=A0A494XBK1_9BURK|nr:DUF4148 domain-containing protein [Trinickia fusca]RKP48207.1 DUF4148 domain-containing protein [Trinickia fusca]
MKSLISAVALAAVLATPIASFAQSNQPVTRADVQQQLVDLAKVGYVPSRGSDPYYPADIQAAEARVAAQHAGTQQAAVTQTAANDVGGVADVKVQAGHAAGAAEKSIFFGQ